MSRPVGRPRLDGDECGVKSSITLPQFVRDELQAAGGLAATARDVLVKWAREQQEARPGEKRQFEVHGYLTISVYAQVEAVSLAAARELAGELSVPTLCHHCASAGEDDDDAWQINGFDDPPEDCVREVTEG